MPLEEDVAWCRSTASGSSPDSSEEEAGSGGYPGDEILAGSMWVIYVDVGMFIPTKQMLNRYIKHIQEMLVGLWSDGWAAVVGSGGEHDVQGSMYLK